MATKSQSTKPAVSADLNADYDSLARENRRLAELNKDLHQQNTELRKSRLLSPQEEESISQLRRDFDRVNAESIKLAKWMQDNKAKEIKQGKHMGMNLSEICIMYMAKGLD
jgi:hypothetical protein